MNIGDRIYKIKTNAIYKIIDLGKDTGIIVAQRVISGNENDNIIKLSDLGGFKLYKVDPTKIEFFDDEYSFLSNFYENPIKIDNMIYSTNEHAFQACKSLKKEDKELIQSASSPNRAKFMGRHIELRDDWENIKDDLMYQICRKKFENPELKQKLLNTGDKILIEGNTWHDNHFGKCICSKCQYIPSDNKLGEILMKIRTELK